MKRSLTPAEARAKIAAARQPARKRGRPEIELVQKPCLHWLSLAGFECWTVSATNRADGSGNRIRRGLPDAPAVMNPRSGAFLMVEFKAPGKKPTTEQLQFRAWAGACGVKVHTWDDVEQCKAWLQKSWHMVQRADGAWHFPYAGGVR